MEQKQNKIEYIELKNIKEQKDLKGFTILPVKISKKVSSKGNIIPQVKVQIEKQFLPEVLLHSGNDMISLDKLNLIILELDLPLKDGRNYDINEWTKKVYVRFVRGQFQSGDYSYQMEVLFKQGLYIVHFLTRDQIAIIERLKDKGLLVLPFIDRLIPTEEIENKEAKD